MAAEVTNRVDNMMKRIIDEERLLRTEVKLVNDISVCLDGSSIVTLTISSRMAVELYCPVFCLHTQMYVKVIPTDTRYSK